MTMLYGTSYGTSPLALRALPLRKGEIRNHTSNIINHTSNINRHEQISLAKNPEHRHHGAYRHRHHFRCDFVHGSVIAHQTSPPCEGGVFSSSSSVLNTQLETESFHSIFKFWKQQDQPSLASVITMRTALTGASGFRMYA